ncbi:MAG: hypothetical protein K2K92_00015 [Duncaniella sp.]|nr:hypothetical protein [Duncaniella sp.]
MDTKFLTLTVPDIYSYKMHTEDGILLYNFDNEDEDTFFSGFMLGSGTLDQCFTAYQIKTSQPEIEKMFAECLDITLLKPDTKTKSAPYQCNGNTIIRVRYTTVYLDEYKYEADCFIIYNESKNRGCYIQSNWGEDSSPLKKIAESIRFK